jgi:peptidoglycan/xylan/chitin deacetylase (PgdA/CDA1 family)
MCRHANGRARRIGERSHSVVDVLDRRRFLAAAAAAVAAACSSGRRRIANASSPEPSTPEASTPATSQTAAPPSADRTTFVSAGSRDRPQVALTFHVSGDAGLVARLLDLLHADHVPITAFMVGNWLDANRDLGVRFVDEGHEVANHTYTHPSFPTLSRQAMVNEVAGCRDAIRRLTGDTGRYFRPSGTANGTDEPAPAVLDAASAGGYRTVVGYDVDPADYQDPGAAAVSKRTIDAMQPGSIVSLHFGHAGTIDALPSILSAIRQRGFTPVTMSSLLA